MFDQQCKISCKFDIVENFEGSFVTVCENQKILVLGKEASSYRMTVQVYENDGRFVNSFGREQDLYWSGGILAANDNQIMVMESDVLVFDSRGNHLRNLSISVPRYGALMAFHQPTEHLLIAEQGLSSKVKINVYTKDGKHIRAICLETENIHSMLDIATTGGRIAILCTTKGNESESEKHLVFVV